LKDVQTSLRFHQKLAFRFIFTIVIILVTLVLLLNLFSIFRQTEILTNTLESKARTVTEIVALTCSNAIIGGDFTFLEESIKAVTNDLDVAYGLIVDRDNYVLVHSHDQYVQQKLDREIDLKAVQSTGLELNTYYNEELKTEVIDAARPIILKSGEKWGVVRFGFSKLRLDRSIRDAFQLAGLTALIFIFAGVIIAYILSKNITRPVETLVEQATLITGGDLDKKIDVSSKDEIKILANAFDEMRLSLKNKINQLARKLDELATLHDVGKAITSTLDINLLIRRILSATKETLGYNRALLFLLDETRNTLDRGVGVGLNNEQREMINTLELTVNEEDGEIENCMKAGKATVVHRHKSNSVHLKGFLKFFDLETVALVPLLVKENPVGLFCVDLSHHPAETMEDEELMVLNIFASQAAIAIENATLYEKTAQKERMEIELQTAKNIQMTLLPQTPPRIQGLDISGICLPATEVGGDYYDFLHLSPRRFGLAIGDVNGHGVPAGLIMALAKSSLRTQIRNNYQPGTVLQIINNVVFDAAQRQLLMTFFYALYDIETKVLTYANAGHNFPYVFQAKTGKLDELMLGGPPLGFRKNRAYQEKKYQLEKNDILILYSDGIVEAENAKRDMYDYERFEHVIKQNSEKTAAEIQKNLLDDLKTFCAGTPFDDDVTFVVMKILV